MTTHNLCETAALAVVPNWPKRLARAAGVPLETARHWIYWGVPTKRRAEVARLILSELDRVDAFTATARSIWGEYVEEPCSLVRRKA